MLFRSGINYWFDRDTIQKLAQVINIGGKFIFDTFRSCPDIKPSVKEYEIEGKSYVEVTWLNGRNIKHIQIMEGQDPHQTQFKWIEPDSFKNKCEELGYEYIKHFCENKKTRIKCKCNKCKFINNFRMTDLMRANIRCKGCEKSQGYSKMQIDWLKLIALSNIFSILVTLLTSQSLIDWLNRDASRNI